MKEKDAERWSRVSEILAHALDLPEQQRPHYLAEVCGQEPALRTEVLALFQEMSGADEFLERPAPAPADALEQVADAALGSYRVVRALGEGGMGVVYLAERSDGQFTRQVAVKRISSVAPSTELLRRFRDEREILARLDHPNIARLLDAGFDSAGIPYLVMEYVDGAPLTVYCRQRRLTVRERLALCLKVCDAVQHAHQNLVIHRDIKPGNILVTETGEPKLLDFGIAKIVGGEAAGDVTRTVNRALSLDYASPEQVRGNAVTTASDVYSLGVLLYELLADARPYDASGKSLTEAVLTVCEQAPPPPSGVAPADRRSLLVGDLDSIAAKAMEKAPADRYGSMGELAADIRAHLDHLPIKARRPSFAYVARKFTRRHRTGTAVAAVVLLLLAAGIAGVLWQSRIAERQRARAERRFQQVRELANFVIFDLQDSVAKLAGSTELRKKMVERSIQYLDSLTAAAAGDPNLQAELAGAYVRLGDVLGRPSSANLGDRAGALASYGKARNLYERALTEDPTNDEMKRRLARLLLNLHGVVNLNGDDRDLAGKTLAETTRIWEDLTRADPQSEENLRGLASTHFAAFFQHNMSDRDAALPHMERALQIFQQLLDANPADLDRKRNVALCHKYLSGFFHGQERSLQHSLRAAELDSQRLAAEPHNSQAKFDYSIDLSTLGDYYHGRGAYGKALEQYERSLALRRELWKADRANVHGAGRLAYMLARMGETHVLAGGHRQAVPLLRESIQRIGEVPVKRRDVSAEATLLRAYFSLGEAEFAAKRIHCQWDRRVSELIRKTPGLRLQLVPGTPPVRLLDRALARAQSCGS